MLTTAVSVRATPAFAFLTQPGVARRQGVVSALCRAPQCLTRATWQPSSPTAASVVITSNLFTLQGATVFDMRYLATVVANCFLAFGEILQMHSRLHQLSGGVSRVAQLLAAADATAALQQDIGENNICAAPLDGALAVLCPWRLVLQVPADACPKRLHA